MKKKLLTFIVTCFLLNGYASAKDLRKEQKEILTPLNFSCSVTRTAQGTESTLDCYGNPISATATASCTKSAATCEQAGDEALSCAMVEAVHQAAMYLVSVINDCPY